MGKGLEFIDFETAQKRGLTIQPAEMLPLGTDLITKNDLDKALPYVGTTPERVVAIIPGKRYFCPIEDKLGEGRIAVNYCTEPTEEQKIQILEKIQDPIKQPIPSDTISFTTRNGRGNAQNLYEKPLDKTPEGYEFQKRDDERRTLHFLANGQPVEIMFSDNYDKVDVLGLQNKAIRRLSNLLGGELVKK